MKKMTLATMFWLLFFFSAVISAEAGASRFPVEVKWDAAGHFLSNTEIFIINLKTTPVDISFVFVSKDGVKLNCGVMPSPVTIEGNHTRTLSPSGCFAIAIGVPLDFVGFGQITAPSKSVSIYWRIYDERVSPPELIDHGKEAP